MKKLHNLLILFAFVTTITFGNIHINNLTLTSYKCKDNFDVFCLYGYNYEDTSNDAFVNNSISNNYFHTLTAYKRSTEQISLIIFDRKVNTEMKKIKLQDDHLNDLLKRKRSQYELHKFTVFGQLTSVVNTEINYHKLQAPRMEGFGLRFRF